jgi:hypothetical protein
MNKVARLFFAALIGVVALPIVCRAGPIPSNRADALSSVDRFAEPHPACNSIQSGACEPFHARVALGITAEGKQEFNSYSAAVTLAVGSQYAATARSCFSTIDKPQVVPFTLVADVTPRGALSAVEVQPATNIASCFAAGLRQLSFPKPPAYPNRNGFPITVEIRIQQVSKASGSACGVLTAVKSSTQTPEKSR